MARESKRFTAGGTEYELRILSGTVEKTEQRSDTVVASGSAYNAGTGTTNTTVSSTIVVTRDIWLREETGEERHLRVSDIPVREGHHLLYLWLAGPGLICGDGALDYGLINLSVNEFRELLQGKIFARRKFLWIFALAAFISLFLGLVAALVVPAFFITWYVSSRNQRKRRDEVLAQLRAIVADLRKAPMPMIRAAVS